MRVTGLSAPQTPRKVRVASREYQRIRVSALLPSSLPSSLCPELDSSLNSLFRFFLFVFLDRVRFVFLFLFPCLMWENRGRKAQDWEEIQLFLPVLIWIHKSHFISMSPSPLAKSPEVTFQYQSEASVAWELLFFLGFLHIKYASVSL